MVKQSVLIMSGFFTRDRFGTPQILAAMLLLLFVAECAWLIAHEDARIVSAEEHSRVQEGMAQWHGKFVAGTLPEDKSASEVIRTRSDAYDPEHSPLWYLTETALIAAFRPNPDSQLWLWLTRAPYIMIGILLGASVWYVSRRLYGNAGGYIALGLYCSSPAVLRSSTLWFSQPNIAGAWGTFGAVFTAIAVAHTLYAPREVVLWNWRRIFLLGTSLALAVGSQFSLAIVLPLLLVFMLYLAPARKGAVIAILAAAVVVALILLFAVYFLHPVQFWHGMLGAAFIDVSGRALRMAGAYLQLGKEIAAAGPVLVLLIPAALAGYIGWRRSRYFGNTAPLVCAVLFGLLRVGSPHSPESVFTLLAVIFCMVFVAGVSADLLETRFKEVGAALIAGLVIANAFWNLVGLARLGP